MDSYINRLYEQLQWLSQEDFSITNFFPYNPNVSYEEEMKYCQISIEFIYRCLKCDLIFFLYDVTYTSEEINSLEEFAQFLADSPVGIEEWKDRGTALQNHVWTCEYFDGTEKLIEICKECDLLDEGFGEFDENSPKWQSFVKKIENIFLEEKVPWNLDEPLFPIKKK